MSVKIYKGIDNGGMAYASILQTRCGINEPFELTKK